MKQIDEGIEYYRIIEKLVEIKSEEDGWVTYFLDEKTNEKWIREYPNSDLHGGGSATLTQLEFFPWEKSD